MSRHSVSQYVNSTDCAALTDLEVRGKPIGRAAALVCEYWPARFGQFPLKDANRLINLADRAFGHGGLWDQIQDIWDERQAKTNYCWRRYKFDTTGASAMIAPPEFDSSRVTLWQNFDYAVDTASAQESIAATCPANYETAPFLGLFFDICKQECITGDLTHNCNLACAEGYWSCTVALTNQFGEVTKLVGLVASFVYANPAIEKATNAIVDLAEWARDVLKSLVDVVKSWFSGEDKEVTTAILLMHIFEFLMENAKQISETIATFTEKITLITDLLVDVSRVGFEKSDISWDWLKETMLSNGAKILDASLSLTDAFLYPRCVV